MEIKQYERTDKAMAIRFDGTNRQECEHLVEGIYGSISSELTGVPWYVGDYIVLKLDGPSRLNSKVFKCFYEEVDGNDK